jgi:hypothetical protein
MIRIEIHGVAADGWRYRLDKYFPDSAKTLKALRKRARLDAAQWRKVFPNDTIEVVEIGTAPPYQLPSFASAYEAERKRRSNG